MELDLRSMAIDLPRVEGHPNRAGFRGVLTRVDEASDRPPSGAKGRRVMLPRWAVETALPSLLGMGLDYAPAFGGHDARRKVGVITSADIVASAIEVEGFLYARDFPEIVKEIGAQGREPKRALIAGATGDRYFRRSIADGSLGAEKRAGQSRRLGMSYEIADACVEDLSAKIWVVSRFTFTGAAVLWRDKAAYQKTWIELA